MVHRHLTDLAIQKLSFTERTYVYDTQLKGFGLRVGTNRKAFIVIRRGRRKTLGLYPYMTLKDARRHAAQHLLGHLAPSDTPRTADAVDTYLKSLKRRLR